MPPKISSFLIEPFRQPRRPMCGGDIELPSARFSPDASADFSDPPGLVPTGRVALFAGRRPNPSPDCRETRAPKDVGPILFTGAQNMQRMPTVGETLCLAIRSSKPKT